MKGRRRPRGLRHLSDSAPNRGSRNRASTLSAAIMAPENTSFMWKVLVSINGTRLSYICQKAQIDRKAKPMSTVFFLSSFIEGPPFGYSPYIITDFAPNVQPLLINFTYATPN